MVEMMNIRKYFDDFHDGALIDMQQYQNEVILSVESAEMDPSDIKDGIQLSEMGTIKGKIHLKVIKSIKINEAPLVGAF
jgi:superfamily I DNA and RNA helicase